MVAVDYAHHPAYAVVHLSENVLLKRNKLSSIMPVERLTRQENFGHSIVRPVYLYRPVLKEQVAALFEQARKRGFTIGLRGAGRSYGDAALNSGGALLSFQRMSRVLEWNPKSGVITVEPGVTIEQLWRYTLDDGWWSPVMPGTMFPTLGGCLGANVHGKNNWKAGPIGEHVLRFDALLPDGRQVTCTPKKNKELFYAMIGGMGLLGVFTSITMQMKKVHSGLLDVYAWAEPDLKGVLEAIDREKENDYIVGWVDFTSGGRGLGRGQMHKANYLKPGEDPYPAQTLNAAAQDLPDNILGIVPKSMVWQFLRLAMHNPGVWAGNTGKYIMNRTIGHKKRYLQSLVAFTFLLDYIPNWERAYGRGGLIQYQSFLPKDTALDVYTEMIKLCKRRRMPSYLGVAKRHRRDSFLLSHAVDGFSVAMDFKVPPHRQSKLIQLTHDLNGLVLSGGGRFYFAKDSTLTADVVRSYLGEATVKKFKKLKSQVDPEGILQTDLYQRCFGE
jgi:decaprenylphospho-beta-D-ribofuranose 2-oxidase